MHNSPTASSSHGATAAAPQNGVDYTVVREGEIPTFLKNLPRWCSWSLETNPGGRPTKRPSSEFPNNGMPWKAVADLPRTRAGGPGFMFTGRVPAKLGNETGHLILLDLDACRDPNTGAIEAWAIEIVQQFAHTHTEVSPSGTGLHVLVLVRVLPEEIRPKVKVPHAAAPNTNGKNTELQVFGLGVAQYVAISGHRLEATPKIQVVDNLDWLIEKFNLRTVGEGKSGDLPIGSGEVPSLDEITARVSAMHHGADLIAGNWQAVMPKKSASEGHWALLQYALVAANNDGAAVVEWQQGTAWGCGQIDSADPDKYRRRGWVTDEVVRAGNKSNRTRASNVFPMLADEADAGAAPSRRVPGAPRVLKVLSLQDLAKMPTRRFVVDGLLHDDSLVVLAGPPKSFKTVLADDLCRAVADGGEWLGLKVTMRGLVIDCALEGMLGKKPRYQAHLSLERFNDPTDPIHQSLFLMPTVPDITTTDGQELLLRAIEAKCKETGEPLRLLKLDTLARGMSIAGLDENSTQDMGAYVAGLDRIRAEFPSLQVVLHHTGKNGDVRGSTAMNGAYDSLLMCKKTGPMQAEIHVKEARDIEVPAPWLATFEPVVVGVHENLRPITGLRVANVRSVEKDAVDQPTAKTTRERLLAAGANAGEDGLSFNEAKTATGKAAGTVSQALKRLVAEGSFETFSNADGGKRWRPVETDVGQGRGARSVRAVRVSTLDTPNSRTTEQSTPVRPEESNRTPNRTAEQPDRTAQLAKLTGERSR